MLIKSGQELGILNFLAILGGFGNRKFYMVAVGSLLFCVM